ncbi:MAG: hypothetical protein R6V32_11980 [Bacteroidales bacterium]
MRYNYLPYLLFLFVWLMPGHSNGQVATDAETVKPDIEPHHAFGITAGYTNNTGLSYRYYKNDFVVQISSKPKFAMNDYWHGEIFFDINAGVAVMYRFHKLRRLNVYAYETTHSFLTGRTHDKTFYVNQGGGICFEILFGKHVAYNIFMGYAALENFEKFSMMGEMALYYHF